MASFRDFGGKFGEDGLNERGRICLDTLDRALYRAAELGCETVYFCGDVFDSRRPEPAIVAGVQRVLRRHSMHGMSFMILPGNHDLMGVHGQAGNTAVEMLQDGAGIYHEPALTSEEGVEPAVFAVPFDGRKPMREVIKEALSKAAGNLRGVALVTHVGVVDDDSPPWLLDSADAIYFMELFDLMDKYDTPLAVVGNYHEHRDWGKEGWKRRITQVGALCPTGFDNPGMGGYGGLATWDGEELHWESVPGPRFVKVPSGQEPPDKPEGCSLFIRAERPARTHRGDDNTIYYDGYEEVEPAPSPLEQIDLAKPAQLLEGAEDAVREYARVAKFSQDVVDKALGYWRRA